MPSAFFPGIAARIELLSKTMPAASHLTVTSIPINDYIEGRPPGEMYAHQRYDEFAPKVYFSSVQSGARNNGGARDAMQLHKYQKGEFGPGPVTAPLLESSLRAAIGRTPPPPRSPRFVAGST